MNPTDSRNCKPTEPRTFGKMIVAILRGVLVVLGLPIAFLVEIAGVLGVAFWFTAVVVLAVVSAVIAFGQMCKFSGR